MLSPHLQLREDIRTQMAAKMDAKLNRMRTLQAARPAGPANIEALLIKHTRQVEDLQQEWTIAQERVIEYAHDEQTSLGRYLEMMELAKAAHAKLHEKLAYIQFLRFQLDTLKIYDRAHS
jgi:hypothetical protein